jgi:hypothetical protein
MVPSWVLLLGLAVCLGIVALLAVGIYLGADREPSRPDD